MIERTMIGGTNGGTAPSPPLTSTERSRRARQRARDAAAAAAGVAPTAATVAPPLQRGGVSAVTLGAGLMLASVSGSFAVVGLTAIFAGAFWPVIAMGVALECGKIAGVTWLGRCTGPIMLKAAIIGLVAVLMLLNSVGCYGFLAAAHIAQFTAAEQAIDGRAAEIEARMRVQTGILADVDKRTQEVGAAVAEATRRGRTTAAMALAAEQTKRRGELLAERTREATKLAALQVDAAGIAGARQRLAADLGPIKYLGELVDVGDAALLRVFILAVAALLDPLAIVLLLAAACRVTPARAD